MPVIGSEDTFGKTAQLLPELPLFVTLLPLHCLEVYGMSKLSVEVVASLVFFAWHKHGRIADRRQLAKITQQNDADATEWLVSIGLWLCLVEPAMNLVKKKSNVNKSNFKIKYIEMM